MTAALLDLLEDGARSSGALYTLRRREPVALSALWDDALAACGWFQARADAGATVAAVLDSSTDCLAVLVGAWLAGLDVASLPAIGPRSTLVEHLTGLTAPLAPLVPTLALVAARHVQGDVVECEWPIVSYEAVLSHRRVPARPVGGGRLVQFSSGTTGRPKGVVLSQQALAANVEAIIDLFEDGEPMTTVSWLPLSHDMGLIGLCLAPWAYMARARGGRGAIALIPPESFMRSPSVWLQACTELSATATCSPNFALDVVARRPAPSTLDLSALRALCVGSEPVRAGTLRRFAAALEPFGFRPEALCPAYGLAEASLVVTSVRPEQMWRSMTLDVRAFGSGRWQPTAGEGLELVSVGSPARGTGVRVSTDGVIEVSGPSLFAGYVGEEGGGRGPDGWFSTGDTGALLDGELYVTGRFDDQISIGGRNIHAAQVERSIAKVAGLAPGRCTAVADEDGRYVLIAERARGAGYRGSLDDVVRAAHIAATAGTGVSPSRVIVVAPRSFPRTANGKVKHKAVRSAFWSDELAIECDSARSAARKEST